MGFELGPAFLRKPPKGWLPASASTRRHVVYDWPSTAWERKARVEREAARLSSPWEYAVERVLNPLSGKARDDEREEAARLDAERRAEVARQEERVRERAEATAAATGNTTTRAQDDDLRARSDELTRIHAEGRRTTAVVVGRTDSGRRIGPIPVIEIAFDVADGPQPRRVVHEHVFGARAAKHYKPGRTVEVWIDPQDPDAICPGR